MTQQTAHDSVPTDHDSAWMDDVAERPAATSVPFKIRLGELKLATFTRELIVRKSSPFGRGRHRLPLEAPPPEFPPGVHGVLSRSLPVDATLPRLELGRGYVRYVPRQYERFYADLRLTYDAYLESFSRNSRSTLRRKARKLKERSGGTIDWRSYETEEELRDFYNLARTISSRSYQERLLDAGLPDSEEFQRGMIESAQKREVRGFLIFLDGQALAYLYCPVRDGVVSYAYLGYLHEFAKLSAGTVLLWLVMEALFREGRYRLFDFAEGGDRSKHSQKRLFATGSVRCADVYVLERTIASTSIVLADAVAESFSSACGRLIERIGAKRIVRRWTRRAWGGATSQHG